MKAAAASAIINFLWQGAAIGAVAALGFSLSRSPRIRYLIGIGALVLMAVAPITTAIVVARDGQVSASTVHSSLPSQVPDSGSSGLESGRGTDDRSEPWTVARGGWADASASVSRLINEQATVVLALWLVGVAVLSARLTWGWIGARRMTRRVTDAGASVKAVADQLIARLHIRARVRVVESVLVKVPAVIGAFTPVVLLPAAAMTGLSMAQIEALLAHELAHVRRHDYLVNLLQSAVETLLFYHPAVWLVSRRVRQERELCCDDIALAVCGDRVAYASALAELEASRVMPAPAVAMAATGGSLIARVRRILGHDEVSALAGRSQSIAGVAILASMLLLGGSQAAGAHALRAGWEIVEAECCGAHPALFSPQRLIPPPPPDQTVQGGVRSGGVGGVVGGTGQGVKEGVRGGDAGGVRIPAAQAAEATGIPAYVIQLSDELAVTVASPVLQPEFAEQRYRVQPDGTVLLPHLRQPIKVAGGTVVAARQAVRQALIDERQYSDPTVDVVVAAYASQRALELPPEPKPQTPQGPAIAVGQIVRLEVVVGQVRQAEFNKDYTVQPDGTIAVPYAGSTKAAGLTTSALQSAIETTLASSGTLPGANVTATIETRVAPEPPKGISVTVQGAVRSPGTQMLREDRNTLADVIGSAGGFLSSAGAQIHLRHANGREEIVQRADLLDGRLNVKVLDGDTVRVELGRHFYVTGFVKNSQSEYNWEPGLTLQRAIAMAGGVGPDGVLNRVSVTRKDPKTGQFTDVKLDKDRMATPIQPDDVIKVPKKRM
jgi:protein involved in polysaccharide export with SLBB domain/beta-lactamase regulating signal transducer with metallopeptidase domain